ncbi:hypothetical protein EVAR_42950_1 [Eumeta japonica]|uniref:FLYWCH-type domain-containing protein n=1 Tax=Eumeta variegata TaxID=151549 RepID=A0A4C1YCN8_EUMVA|nr:hypothetical protein EVAR_42950_1 [Eumeta japonica]
MRIDGQIYYSNENHTHPPPVFHVTKDDTNYILVPTRKKNLLVFRGHTFSHSKTKSWYCSKRTSGCKAAVYLNNDNRIENYRDSHTHPPPRFYITKNGDYVKI